MTIRLTNTGTPNAVLSGLFFGGARKPSGVNFVGTDTATQGNWKSVYGADGYLIVNDATETPSYATIASSSLTHTWAASTSDVRCLEKATTAGRIAACAYSPTTLDYALDLSGGPHRVALYLLDWELTSRASTVEILHGTTGAVLHSTSVSALQGGTYLVYDLSGRVTIRLTNTGTPNAVISGLFFGAARIPPAVTVIGYDQETNGDWDLAYGADGYHIIGNQTSYPAYAQVVEAGPTHVWADPTTDVRGLIKVGGGRIAACTYTATSLTYDLNLNLAGGVSKQVAIYCVDWDVISRTQTLQITNAATGAVLATPALPAFAGGHYYVLNITGHVRITLTNIGPVNAVMSGIFFGAPIGGPFGPG